MPVPTSPYHFYERNGYQVRESRNGELIKIEVETSKDSFVTAFEGLGPQQASKALNSFILPRRVTIGA